MEGHLTYNVQYGETEIIEDIPGLRLMVNKLTKNTTYPVSIRAGVVLKNGTKLYGPPLNNSFTTLVEAKQVIRRFEIIDVLLQLDVHTF